MQTWIKCLTKSKWSWWWQRAFQTTAYEFGADLRLHVTRSWHLDHFALSFNHTTWSISWMHCVSPPDNDVFIFLIHHYRKLPQSELFKNGPGGKLRKINIGEAGANAILCFLALNGCNQAGRFNCKAKLFRWKHLLDTSVYLK